MGDELKMPGDAEAAVAAQELRPINTSSMPPDAEEAVYIAYRAAIETTTGCSLDTLRERLDRIAQALGPHVGHVRGYHFPPGPPDTAIDQRIEERHDNCGDLWQTDKQIRADQGQVSP